MEMVASHPRIKARRAIAFLTMVAFAALLAAAEEGRSERESDALLPFQSQFLGTSLFVLTSLIPNSGSFFAVLDYGIRLGAKDSLLLGADVWKYSSPMGNPWSSEVSYPGSVLSYGVIAGYQRFLWKGLYASLLFNALAMDYSDSAGQRVGSGFQLMTTLRAGYHFEFSLFDQSCYFEPGGELNWWPLNLGVPAAFSSIDAAYPNYVFSPALNVGVYIR